MRTFVLALLLTLSVQAQEAARIAALVQEPTLDAAPLATALQSQEPRVRATAARVATVRGVTALVPALRTALESESDAEAASEHVRAITLLGSDDDVAFAAAQSGRFPAFVDEALADGIARIGVPRALNLYLRHRQSLRGVALSSTLPHWRTELHVMPTAARLLQARDAASFAALLRTLEASGRTLDAGIATIALASEDAAIRAAAEQHRAPLVAETKPATRGRVSTKATEIPTPSFRLPFALPRGLGAEILS
jgi:HEAT repeat protein